MNTNFKIKKQSTGSIGAHIVDTIRNTIQDTIQWVIFRTLFGALIEDLKLQNDFTGTDEIFIILLNPRWSFQVKTFQPSRVCQWKLTHFSSPRTAHTECLCSSAALHTHSTPPYTFVILNLQLNKSFSELLTVRLCLKLGLSPEIFEEPSHWSSVSYSEERIA